LVANVAEILELEPTEDELEEAELQGTPYKKQKNMVVKTSTRQTIFLPIPGLVPVGEIFLKKLENYWNFEHFRAVRTSQSIKIDPKFVKIVQISPQNYFNFF